MGAIVGAGGEVGGGAGRGSSGNTVVVLVKVTAQMHVFPKGRLRFSQAGSKSRAGDC